MQHIPECHHLVVDSCPGASVANIGVYAVGKIEHSSSLGKFHQFALGSKHKHLILVQVHLELVNHLQVVLVFQCGTYAVEPFVETTLALDALVSPVCSQATLGHLVHAFGAYLHLHPLAFGSEHGDVKTLIAI